MIKQIIVTLITLPFRAFFLWFFTGLEFDRGKIIKAVFVTSFLLIIVLICNLIKVENQTILFIHTFLNSWYFQAMVIYIALLKFYEFAWTTRFLITIFWMAAQIPINIFQMKLYGWLF
ncbi:MAG: hypothetical protein DRI23_04705 [Candidatus Cloacimonadota bacterium]|nr:MAG: hypothetical protein DRI23_04705 [Candidatus Cloacimonadota bacterium]